MKQPIKKTILIVCEGGGTESSYFESIRDNLIDQKIDVKITISPIPKNENLEKSYPRKGAKKRTLKKIDIKAEIELRKYEIEKEYKAQPIRYVREAQMGLEDGSFEEVWAVYDKNGHPRHKEALELASREVMGKKVNIAFSSISFEYWILLHFEKCISPFTKSKCREGDFFYECGTKVHAKDCMGESCVCGYLVSKQYISGSLKKKQFLLSELPSYSEAIRNAAYLRSHQLKINSNQPIYEINPITTVDRLVFKLLNYPINYCWFELDADQKIKHENILIFVQKFRDSISFVIKNINVQRFILNEGFFVLINPKGEIYSFGTREIIDNESKSLIVLFRDLQNFDPVYFGFKTGENEYHFSDL